MARRSARSRQEVASGPGRHEPDQRCNRSNAASGALAGQPSPSAQPTKARNGPSITSAMAARGCTMMPTCSRLPADCTVPPSAAPPAPRRLHAAPSRPELALGSAASPRQRLGPRRFVGLGLEGCATLDVELFTDLFRLVASYDLMVPPEVAAVFRALATLEATLAQLAPGFDIVAESRAFAAAQLTSQLQPTSLRQAASDELPTLLPVPDQPRLPDPAGVPGRRHRHHGRGAARHQRRAEPQPHRQPVPPARLQLLVVSAVLILRVLVVIFRPPR